MNKAQLVQYIKRKLGYPMIKVELHETHFDDIINDAYTFHKKWGVGISSKEVFITKQMTSGVNEYTLPKGITSVIEFKDVSSNLGGSQQLFSINNAIWMQYKPSFQSFNLVSYEIAMQFIDLLERYDVSKFNWRHREYDNTLIISPIPTDADVRNNTYMLLRCFMEEGYDLVSETQDPLWFEHLYDDNWFKDYCVALAKVTLGHIRRKMENIQVMGSTSLSLDGEAMLSEGKEERELLEEELKNNTEEGMDIFYA